MSRTASARRRARIAQICLGAGAVVLFGGSVAAVRANVAGHAKSHVQPRSSSTDHSGTARRNDGFGSGSIAPSQSPPQTATGES